MIVQVNGISKDYGAVKALDNISFSINRGEIFGLLGPNGAGKTTIVKVLATLIKPGLGNASIADVDVSKEPGKVRGKIGYVCQELTSDRYLSGRENLLLQGKLCHIGSDIGEKISDALSLVGLEKDADRQVKEYSGGMRKRLDIACGLLHRPELLILDEPTLGLDPPSRMRVWDHILEINKSGTTIILCTNYLEEADRMCSRVAIIDGGTIKITGKPEELKKSLGGDVITAKLTSDAGFLKELDFVKGVSQSGDETKIYVDSNEEALPKLLKALSARGIHAEKISYSRPSLDEVFAKYTGKRL